MRNVYVNSGIASREEIVRGRFVLLVTSSSLETTVTRKFIGLLPRAIMLITHSSSATFCLNTL
jgi:hypothetical protein